MSGLAVTILSLLGGLELLALIKGSMREGYGAAVVIGFLGVIVLTLGLHGII